MDQNLIDKNQSQEEPQQNPPYIPNINSYNSNTAFNSTQNMVTQEEPYYSSQTTNNDQQYPSQTNPVQPYPTQNMGIPPNQSYYPPQGATPIQPGAKMSNFQLQPGVLNIQPNPHHIPLLSIKELFKLNQILFISLQVVVEKLLHIYYFL